MKAGHAWVFGASHGIGRALSEQLHKAGWSLTLSARTPNTLQPLCEAVEAQCIPCDATDRDAVNNATQFVFQHQRPDLIIFNVGDYEQMPASRFNAELCERLNKTNYLSACYLLENVIPLMKGHGGTIALNASASSYRGLPNGGAYSAPKAALVNLAESLRPELAEMGIDIRVINPGFVKTRLTDRNDFEMPFLLEPEEAAKEILDGLLNSKRFDINFPRALTWPLRLLRMLPDQLFFGVIKRKVLRHE